MVVRWVTPTANPPLHILNSRQIIPSFVLDSVSEVVDEQVVAHTFEDCTQFFAECFFQARFEFFGVHIRVALLNLGRS